MKRNDMLRELEAFFFWNKRLANSDLAEATLKFIEEKGMMPNPGTDPCEYCGELYGEHDVDCDIVIEDDELAGLSDPEFWKD